jgi:hypothetical protein
MSFHVTGRNLHSAGCNWCKDVQDIERDEIFIISKELWKVIFLNCDRINIRSVWLEIEGLYEFQNLIKYLHSADLIITSKSKYYTV